MNGVFGVATYVLIWWVVIFAVLPFGIRPAEEGDVGHTAGAPANPRLRLKIVITTAITTFLWLLAYGAYRFNLVDLHVSLTR